MLLLLPWDILVWRVAVWLGVGDLGKLCSSSRQLVALLEEGGLWRALYGREIPCRTALAEKNNVDWQGLLRLHYETLTRNPGDHVWLRITYGEVQVPVPYVETSNPAALLLALTRLLAKGSARGSVAGKDTELVLCVQRYDATMAGEPLMLMQNGRLVSSLEDSCGAGVCTSDMWRTSMPPPRTMRDLHLPAVANLLFTILQPAPSKQRRDHVTTVPASGVSGLVNSQPPSSWIVLRVLIPQFGSTRSSEGGVSDSAAAKGEPLKSPSKWRALASRAAGVDVGAGDEEGQGCLVWVRANANMEELSLVLETHTKVSRYIHIYICIYICIHMYIHIYI